MKFIPTILVDTREQTPWSFSRFSVERATLQHGDYSLKGLTDLVTIERKSLGDLVGCCGHGRDRFTRELRAMRGYSYRLLVVETTATRIAAGDWRSDKMTPAHIFGALASWSTGLKVPVWLGGSPGECAEYVERWLYQAARHVCERYAAARAIVEAMGNET